MAFHSQSNIVSLINGVAKELKKQIDVADLREFVRAFSQSVNELLLLQSPKHDSASVLNLNFIANSRFVNFFIQIRRSAASKDSAVGHKQHLSGNFLSANLSQG